MKFPSGPEPSADALGVWRTTGPEGPAELETVAAAGLTAGDRPSSSRRLAATAVHASAATPGPPLSPPDPNQDNRSALRADTDPDVAGTADITGAATAPATRG